MKEQTNKWMNNSGRNLASMKTETIRWSLKVGRLFVQEVPPHIPYSLQKGRYNFITKKHGKYHFIQVIKINIPDKRTKWHHMAPTLIDWEHITYERFLPKMGDLNLTMRYYQMNSTWGIFCTTVLDSIKMLFFYGAIGNTWMWIIY